MNGDNPSQPLQKSDERPTYWEEAGAVGHNQHKYASLDCALHCEYRVRDIAQDVADQIGVPRDGFVLDLGSGDGEFANKWLAPKFRLVEGMEFTVSGVDSSNKNRAENSSFNQADLRDPSVRARIPKADGVFLMGILHHIKQAAPAFLIDLGKVTDRVIVMEPNGNNILRKLLEFTPAYRSAGEESFRITEMERLFAAAGFVPEVRLLRINPFSVVYPNWLYKILLPHESSIEKNPILKQLCTVNMWGLRRKAVS